MVDSRQNSDKKKEFKKKPSYFKEDTEFNTNESQSGISTESSEIQRFICCIGIRGKVWILFAVLSSIFFTLCNLAIASITFKVGPFVVFYFSSGTVFTGLLYNFYYSFRNYQAGG